VPILNVDQAKRIIVLKRSMAAGFSGVENDLFYHLRRATLFGDANTSVQTLIRNMKEA
jgi:NAD(P) transhydrogenase subunit beta